MKSIISIVLGLVLTISLLLLMTSLIADPEPAVLVSKVELDSEPVTMPEEKPPEVTVPPKPPAASIEPSIDGSEVQIQNTEISLMEPISLADGMATELPSTVFMVNPGIGLGIQDRSAVALYQAQPKYPLEAQMNGVEGWVKLQYDVDPAGLAINIQILDAHPKKTFDKVARNALKRWKFKAALENGMAVSVYNQKVTMNFELDEF